MTVAEFLTRLKGVKRDGKAWKAFCPGHEDADQSLGISEGRAGRILVRCYGGCTTDHVLEVMGLRMSDLFTEPATPARTFDELDAGRLLAERGLRPETIAHFRIQADIRAQAWRFPIASGAKFKKFAGTPKNWWADAKPPGADTYNLRAAQGQADAWLVEGEPDVWIATQAGIPAFSFTCGATTIPAMGVAQVAKAGIGTVHVLYDRDAAGRDGSRAAARALRSAGATVVLHDPPAELPQGGDLTDLYRLANFDDAELRARLAALPPVLDDAEPQEDTGGARLRSLHELMQDPHALEPPAAVVPRIAWSGRVTLFAAREKDGKSTLAAAAAARLTRGGPFLDGRCEPATVLWIGLEEHTGDIARRFVRFGADPERLYLLDNLSDPLTDILTAVERLQPTAVFVDTLAALADMLPEPPDPGSSKGWTPVMAALTHPARSAGCAVVLLAHARKSDGRYRDSTAIGAGVDVILEMATVEGGDDTVRKIRGRGRWPISDFTVRLVGDRFEIDGGQLSVDARVLLYVEAHPHCSTRDVRNGVDGSNKDKDEAIRRLLSEGHLKDDGDASSGRRLRCAERLGTPPAPARPTRRTKNPRRHAPGTVSARVPAHPCRPPKHIGGHGGTISAHLQPRKLKAKSSGAPKDAAGRSAQRKSPAEPVAPNRRPRDPATGLPPVPAPPTHARTA